MASSTTAAPQVYGADEVNAVVLDPGSHTTRIGYAGYDTPSLVLPSYYGEVSDESGSITKRVYNDSVLYMPKENMKIKPILNNSIVDDWEGAINQYKYMFKEMSIDPQDQPLLLTESTLNSYKNKEKALELFLEQENFCAFYAAKQPTCVSFALGRTNCLVVDIGHDLVTATPVVDGFSLRNQVMGTRYAGAFVDQQLKQFLKEKDIEIIPHYQVKSKIPVYWEKNDDKPSYKSKDYSYTIDESIAEFSNMRTLLEMKETLMNCTLEKEEEELKERLRLREENTNSGEEDLDDTRDFEMPNGLSIPFTEYERTKLSNSLFNPSQVLPSNGIVQGWEDPHTGNIIKALGTGNEKNSKLYVPLRRNVKKSEEEDKDKENGEHLEGADSELSQSTNGTEAKEGLGLTKLVQSVLDKLDADLKPQLANNIVLTGSTSLVPNLNRRLHEELAILNPSMKIRVHSSGNTIERKYASYIGGSILSSLGTFHQLWVSQAEYKEVGPERLIVSRFR